MLSREYSEAILCNKEKWKKNLNSSKVTCEYAWKDIVFLLHSVIFY